MSNNSRISDDKTRLLASYRARHSELERAIKGWCKAQNEWQRELREPMKWSPERCGFPRLETRDNLHEAGNRLFRIACVTPAGGVYTKTRDK